MCLQKTTTLILFSLFINTFVIAQNKTKGVHVYGKIIESTTNQPVGFSSVTLFSLPKDSLISGALVSDDGTFSFSNIAFGTYKLRVQFIGYKNLEQTLVVSSTNLNQDLGNILIESDAKVLNEVQIVGEKQTLVMSIDKKIYNVGKDLSVKGGTGLDALKNVPGVSVDVDGSVTLRNNSVQIYIDGKQTALTMQQIPADQIESIEVITNPSAKYDANTSGGILNVILKKNTQPNYNGSIIAGIGTNQRYNTTLTLNARNRLFNFSGTYSYNTENNNVKGYTIRDNITNPVPIKYFNQHDLVDLKRSFQLVRLSLDYYINKKNTITIGGTLNQGSFLTNDNQNYTSSDANNAQYSSGTRDNNSTNTFGNYISQLNYRKTFDKKGKELTSSVQYTYGNSGGGYLYTTNTTIGTTPSPQALQKNDINGSSQMFIFQTDYTNPINDSTKLEFGIKGTYKQNRNINTTSNYSNTTDSYLYDSVFSNNYLINDIVNAAYINYSTRIKKINVQGGLRFEDSYYQGKVLNKTGENFGYSYPSSASTLLKSIFPALYFSKKTNTNNEFQFNITRKINRPNFFQMLPIVIAADNFNYRIGNPRLQPEFVNKAEINYNFNKKNINYLTSIYGQYTQNSIVYVSSPSSTNPNLLINTYKNGKSSFTYGWENILKITLIKNLTITGTATPYYTIINYSTASGAPLQAKGYSVNTKLVISYKLPKDFTFQANGTYEAPKPLAQGKTTDLHYFDLSLNKTIKQFLFLNLTLSDVLNSKQRGSNYFTPDYTQYLMNRREARYLKFTVTCMFGKSDNAMAKKKSTKPANDNGDVNDF